VIEIESLADVWDAGFRALFLNLHGDTTHTRIRNPFVYDRPCPCREDHGSQPSEREAS
jgi:hypothetical protein